MNFPYSYGFHVSVLVLTTASYEGYDYGLREDVSGEFAAPATTVESNAC